MKAVFGLLAALVVYPAALLSCSIKTDRSDCPCRLSIIMDSPMPQQNLQLTREKFPVMEKAIVKEDFSAGVCVVDVVRGKYVFSICCGSPVVSEGKQCDSLYVWSSMDMLDVNCEEAAIYPEMHKQFATLIMEISIENFGSGELDMRITGDVCGLDVSDLKPCPGRFACSPDQIGEGEFLARIPRQSNEDNALKAELVRDGVTMAVLPLGEYIAYTGYDWSEQDLGDVYIQVSCIETEFGVEVMNWKVGFQKDAVL